MKKTYIGIGLIFLGILLAKFLPLDSLGTGSIAILMAFGAMAWVGIVLAIPNEAGENFKLWKMLLKGALGMGAMVLVLVLGLNSTKDYIDTELRDYGITANAVVMSTETTTLPAKRGQVNYIHYATVSFVNDQGKPKTLTAEISEQEMRYAHPGREVQLVYSSRNEDINKLKF